MIVSTKYPQFRHTTGTYLANEEKQAKRKLHAASSSPSGLDSANRIYTRIMNHDPISSPYHMTVPQSIGRKIIENPLFCKPVSSSYPDFKIKEA